jgi:integrase/recombinase XerD
MALDAAGLHSTPKKIGEEEIDYLLEEWAGHCRPKTKRWYISIFAGYLRTNKNHIVAEMMLGWPADARVNVDWLSLDEAVCLTDAAIGAEVPVVHSELRLLMRRCELMRLTVQDIYVGALNVRGKGRYEGKWRTLAWSPETLMVLQDWLDRREDLVAEAMELDSHVEVPKEFLIYRAGKRLSPYSESGIDKLLHQAAERANIDRSIGNHMLRRSGSRFAIEADPSNMTVLVETLGHESEAQTRRYCGLTIDGQSKMHQDVSAMFNEARQRMGGKIAKLAPPSVRIRN